MQEDTLLIRNGEIEVREVLCRVGERKGKERGFLGRQGGGKESMREVQNINFVYLVMH